MKDGKSRPERTQAGSAGASPDDSPQPAALELIEGSEGAGETGHDEEPGELFRLCADLGNTQAWERFICRFHPLIVATVLRTARRYTVVHPNLCEDLTQEVYLKFSAHGAKVLREFQPRYPRAVFGYVQIIAANVVRDYFKSRWVRDPPVPLPEILSDNDDSEWPVFVREIDDRLRRHTEQTGREMDRRIFWLYYRHGLTAKEIAALPEFKLSVKGVESVIERLKRYVQDGFRDRGNT